MNTPSVLMRPLTWWSVLVLLCFPPLSVSAAQLQVDIIGQGAGSVNVVLARPSGDSGRASALQKAITNNLSLLPFVRMIDPNGIPGGADVGGPSADKIDFKRFSLAKANLLISANWTSSDKVELRCFEVGNGRFMFGNAYDLGSGEEGLLDAADRFCADLLDVVIGDGAFFRSSMAFVKSEGPRKKDIWAVKPNGRHLRRLTNLNGEALSPTWSPDGGRVLFSFIGKRSHALGVYDTSGKSVQTMPFPGNTVIGPCYMPDGRVAVSLTDGKNPSIYLLSSGLQKEGRLDSSSAIDVSPSVDRAGNLMAFTSNRLGSPQIFLKDLRSGSVRRVTTQGSYNTDPSISPDGSLVAFARQEGGGHRIYVVDLTTGQERQITSGPGSDEEPAFAADNYFIAFMSTRGGKREIWLTTRQGGEPRRLPTGPGDAAFPAWGPAKKQ